MHCSELLLMCSSLFGMSHACLCVCLCVCLSVCLSVCLLSQVHMRACVSKKNQSARNDLIHFFVACARASKLSGPPHRLPNASASAAAPVLSSKRSLSHAADTAIFIAATDPTFGCACTNGSRNLIPASRAAVSGSVSVEHVYTASASPILIISFG